MSDAAPDIRITPRLVRDRQPTQAELWIIEWNAREQLTAWVNQADEWLVQRFHVAFVRRDQREMVVLLARGGRGTAPVLVLDAKPFRSYLQLPNLFIPVGAKPQPPLRRDWARQTFAADRDMITCLDVEAGGIAATRIAVSALRPLSECITYHPPARRDLTVRAITRLDETSAFEVKDRSAPIRLRARSDTPDNWQTIIKWGADGWQAVSQPIGSKKVDGS